MFKIKMFFTKLFHGEYSFQYIDLFKKSGFRSPFLRCINDEFFYHILMFLKKDPKVKVFDTSETIKFGNTSFSLTSDELLKTKGLPHCFNAFIFNEYDVKVIGYQEIIQNTKLKSFHVFANGVFILGEYSFSDVNKVDSLNISKILIKKYISDSIENLDNFFIKDVDNNHIYFSDNGFEMTIKYFNVKDAKSREIYSDFEKMVLKTDSIEDDVESKLAEML